MNESHQTPTQFRKKKEVIPIQYSEEEQEQRQEMDIRADSIERELSLRYTPEMVTLFKRLAYELSVVGLPISDACLILGIDPTKLEKLIETDETVRKLIALKDLQYKRGLLITVSAKAKEDEKLSMWMLERRYPNEFNPKKGNGNPDGDDALKMAINFIQIGGDSKPLVATKSADSRAFIVEEKDGVNESRGLIKRMKDILS